MELGVPIVIKNLIKTFCAEILLYKQGNFRIQKSPRLFNFKANKGYTLIIKYALNITAPQNIKH